MDQPTAWGEKSYKDTLLAHKKMQLSLEIAYQRELIHGF